MSGKGKANHSKSVRRKVWQYKHADFDKANDLLTDIQTSDVLDYSGIERSWHNWKQVFLGIMEECIPCSTLPNRKNLPWLTKHIIQLRETICLREHRDQETHVTTSHIKRSTTRLFQNSEPANKTFLQLLIHNAPETFEK